MKSMREESGRFHCMNDVSVDKKINTKINSDINRAITLFSVLFPIDYGRVSIAVLVPDSEKKRE